MLPTKVVSADTMLNLGASYFGLSEVENNKDNLTKSIKCYEDSLEIFKIYGYTHYINLTLFNLDISIQQERSLKSATTRHII